MTGSSTKDGASKWNRVPSSETPGQQSTQTHLEWTKIYI